MKKPAAGVLTFSGPAGSFMGAFSYKRPAISATLFSIEYGLFTHCLFYVREEASVPEFIPCNTTVVALMGTFCPNLVPLLGVAVLWKRAPLLGFSVASFEEDCPIPVLDPPAERC